MKWTMHGRGHEIYGQHLTWAGEYPLFEGALAFGSEEGKLHILPALDANRVYSQDVTTDAVNGMACWGGRIAITSRNEIVLATPTDTDPALLFRTSAFNFGAHGIVASHDNVFVAPLGLDGFFLLKPGPGFEVSGRIATSLPVPLNFHKMVRLGESATGEVFACAAREDGLLAITLRDGDVSNSFFGHHLLPHDIIDVCPISSPTFPLAAACMSRKGTIFLFKDVLANHPPTVIHYPELQGTAYTILESMGHLFILTDREFHVLEHLATRFLTQRAPSWDTEVASMPCDGFEAFKLRDQSILILEDAEVLQFEVAELVAGGKQARLPSNGAAHTSLKDVEVETRVLRARPSVLESRWSGSYAFDMVLIPA